MFNKVEYNDKAVIIGEYESHIKQRAILDTVGLHEELHVMV
jgi:hypothetical protein